VYRETVLRFGSKERLGNVYFEHIVALHVGVCAHSSAWGTLSIDLEFLNVSDFYGLI